MSLTKALDAIKKSRKVDEHQRNKWLRKYGVDFDGELELIMGTQDPPSSDDEDEAYSQGLQSSKAPKSKVGGEFSKNKTILEISVELFYEIVSYLKVQDFLSLSRTCKHFRGLLMSSSKRSLWKDAITRVDGLPPCPRDISEPRYASLVFSNTCSECGETVLHRMDIYLLVRLCETCRAELLESFPDSQGIGNFFPVTPRTYFGPDNSRVFALRRDVDALIAEIGSVKTSSSSSGLDSWAKSRMGVIGKRKAQALELDECLDDMMNGRLSRAENERRARRQEVEKRLLSAGWTQGDFYFPRGKNEPWNKLVLKRAPLTDSAWSKLYPKLKVILEAKREDNKRKAREERRKERQLSLIGFLNGLDRSFPAQAAVAVQGPLSDYASTMSRCDPFERDSGDTDITKVKMPFPTPAETLALPTIKKFVETDSPTTDIRGKLDKLRATIHQEIVAWQVKVQRDLVEIWQQAEQETVITSQQGSSTSTVRRSGDLNKSSSDKKPKKNQTFPQHVSLPRVTVEFVKPDGTVTSNIQELSEELQLLLRADTIFQTEELELFVRRRSYPHIIPRAEFPFYDYVSNEYNSIGETWNPTAVVRDEHASNVARTFLEWVGRANATSAEMRALGATFQCGRCQYLDPGTWENLVSHYATEISRFEDAQARIKELGSSTVYRNSHVLDSNKGAFFKFVPPDPRESRTITIKSDRQMNCKLCEELGIRALYLYVSETRPSPILEHLANAHGIKKPVLDKHFEAPSNKGQDGEWMYEPDEDDEQFLADNR